MKMCGAAFPPLLKGVVFEMWLEMASIHHDEESYSQYLERLNNIKTASFSYSVTFVHVCDSATLATHHFESFVNELTKPFELSPIIVISGFKPLSHLVIDLGIFVSRS